MWWKQFCAWIALQYEHESDLDQQIRWKSLIHGIPEATRCPEEYAAFLVRWRALIAEEQHEDSFSLAYTQKLLSIIDSTLVHIAEVQNETGTS
jgi:hypothetical protein